MILTDADKELIISGLQMRMNFIETGDPLLSARDAKNMKKLEKIKVLSTDQHRLIVQISDIIEKIRYQK